MHPPPARTMLPFDKVETRVRTIGSSLPFVYLCLIMHKVSFKYCCLILHFTDEFLDDYAGSVLEILSVRLDRRNWAHSHCHWRHQIWVGLAMTLAAS